MRSIGSGAVAVVCYLAIAPPLGLLSATWAMAQTDPRMGPTGDAVRPLFQCANEHSRFLAVATPDDDPEQVLLATLLACAEIRDANLQSVMEIWGSDFSQRLVDYIDSKTAELTKAAFLDEKAKSQ